MDLGVGLRMGLGRVPLWALGLGPRAWLGVDPGTGLCPCLGRVAGRLPRIRLRGVGADASVVLLVRRGGGVALGRSAAVLRVLRVAVRVHASRSFSSASRVPGPRGGASLTTPSARVAQRDPRPARGPSRTGSLLRAGTHSPRRGPANACHAPPASSGGGELSRIPPRHKRRHVRGATRERRTFLRFREERDRPTRVPGNALRRPARRPTRRPPRLPSRAAFCTPSRVRLPLPLPNLGILDRTFAIRHAWVDRSLVPGRVPHREPHAVGPLDGSAIHAAHASGHGSSLSFAIGLRAPFGKAFVRHVGGKVIGTHTPDVRHAFSPVRQALLRRAFGTTFLRRARPRPDGDRKQVRTEQGKRRRQGQRGPGPRQPKGRSTLIIRGTSRRNEHVQQP